jgi:hypothetical protein
VSAVAYQLNILDAAGLHSGVVVLLVVPIMEVPEQQNCLAVVIFVSLLWASEVCMSYVPPKIMLTYPGNPPLRNLPPRPLPRRNPQRCPQRHCTPQTSGVQSRRRLVRLQRYVDPVIMLLLGSVIVWYCRNSYQ